jgi:hypothetical protein
MLATNEHVVEIGRQLCEQMDKWPASQVNIVILCHLSNTLGLSDWRSFK